MKKSYIHLTIGIPVFLAIVAIGVYLHTRESTSPIPVVQVPEVVWFSVLDGTKVLSEFAQVPFVLGVMIDNHPDARSQQAGLSQARIVYEALAEGGITRFLAVFNTAQELKKVGPVRSARPYYLDWVREYGQSTYWHSGGSPEALTMIKKLGLASTNEFSHGQYYWRDKQFDAPHNLFTSYDLWTKLLARRKEVVGAWNGWLFERTPQTSSTTVKGVTIKYAPDYHVTWKFENDRYVRSLNNSPHTDGGLPLLADTVIVQEVQTRIVDDVGRKDLETVGKGTVRIFKHGGMFRGTWEKTSATSRTRFFDNAAQELLLAPGVIWVQVVPLNITVDITG